MTLLTVDAKLMPILPLIARPESKRALVVAFGMGTAFRAALIAGLRTDAVELVPSRPRRCSAGTTTTPTGRWPTRTDGSIIADGRNHLELSDERFDIIVTDPPPPIESSGASVISSLEYYEAGRDHLTPGGVMMQWTPYGAPESDLKEHIRTFAAVFPHVIAVRRARAATASTCSARRSRSPWTRDVARGPGAARGPRGHLDARTTRRQSTIDGWLAVIDRADLAGRRRGHGRTPATGRSSPTTSRDPSTSSCAAVRTRTGRRMARSSQLTRADRYASMHRRRPVPETR